MPKNLTECYYLTPCVWQHLKKLSTLVLTVNHHYIFSCLLKSSLLSKNWCSVQCSVQLSFLTCLWAGLQLAGGVGEWGEKLTFTVQTSSALGGKRVHCRLQKDVNIGQTMAACFSEVYSSTSTYEVKHTDVIKKKAILGFLNSETKMFVVS